MKHKTSIILLLIIMLIASSGSALAQGTTPPADNPEALPKSAFISPGTGSTNQDAIPLERRAAHILATSALVNGNFEQGPNVGWTENSNHAWPVVTPASDLPQSVPPHSGNWVAWLGGDNYELAYISQYIATLPTSASLRLVYWIASTDDCGYDYAQVKINSVPVHQWDLCTTTSTNGWVVLDLDLSAYGGQAVNISIEVSTDVGYYSNLFIDDNTYANEVAGTGSKMG